MTERILVFGPKWVGDSVMAQSLYERIKQLNSAATIDVVAPKYLHSLLKRMPQVKDTIYMPLAHGQLGLRERRRIGISLRKRYNQAIILKRSFKVALIPWFAKIPIRTGFRGEMRYGLINDMRQLNSDEMPRLVDRFVSLGQPKQTPLPKNITPSRLIVKPANAQMCMEHLGIDNELPIMILAPGTAASPSKQWPARHFAKLAEHYGNRGYQIWILGSRKDQDVCRQITKTANIPIHNLCGRTTLEDSIDLLAQAEKVVSNDSGLMHIAAAVGCSVVGIFGSTPPEYALPISDHVRYSWANLSCSPCWQRTCRYGHYHCLTHITPQEVISVVGLLGKHTERRTKAL
ncbi:MAG: lipopolysaccharide heptosyltransferase II [Aestuariivita sp.]|nr:lipopolysaccharide heptosyltransferase II [Aestuariivita sp.]